jgi:Cu2+-exporting ATPase
MPIAASCFHCGEPVAGSAARRAFVLGEEHEFCCAGCEAVALVIAGAGLESYYRTRTSLAIPEMESISKKTPTKRP